MTCFQVSVLHSRLGREKAQRVCYCYFVFLVSIHLWDVVLMFVEIQNMIVHFIDMKISYSW